MSEQELEFAMKTPQEVQEAVRAWVRRIEKIYDEDFGMCLLPEHMDIYSVDRWKARLGPAASPRGYHGVSQDSTYYALSLLRLGEKPERARKILRRVLEAQVRDESSRRHGAFKLVYEAAGNDVLDGNTTFFVCMALIPAVREYAGLLGEELAGDIKDALSLIPSKEYERDLGVSYTNAHLGHAAIELTICEMLNDRDRYEVARRGFDYFYDMNMSRGFPERLSSTYYMVDLAALGMILSYVKDERVLVRAREMLAVFAQELLFFEERQPLPARRTYNQDTGAALTWGTHSWLLGAVPCPAAQLEAIIEERSPHGFEHAGGWIALCEIVLRRALDPRLYQLPAPRQMRGRHVDEIGYTSYFHKDFTLGAFDLWPPLTVGGQHPSDIPVGFAGASADLVYFGVYSIDAEDALQTHPGTGRVGTPSRTALPRLTYAASQYANVCCLLTNITGTACDLREYGWMLRGLQFTGKLYESGGAELTGTGAVDTQWVFLATDEYFTGVYPLKHFDPTDPVIETETMTCFDTSLRYEFAEGKGLTIFAPNFRCEPPWDMKGNNMPAGAILALGSARDTGLTAFRQACLNATVHDEWYIDGWNARFGYKDCERRVGICAPGGELRLAFDYLENKVVSRSFNGRELAPPTELSAVRLGVQPWLYQAG